MRRRLIALSMAVAMIASVGFSATTFAAHGENRNERACVGGTVSHLSKEFHPIGEIIREEAKDFHPFGKTVISVFATTCELLED